jgi:two-component system chemotaxis response regulator CheB
VVTASTGGPNALTELLGDLGPAFPLPILVVQHMPALFTQLLAQRLATASGRRCVEAADSMPVEAGVTYVAPGDRHMTVERGSPDPTIRLNQDPPENFCRPAADVLFRSAGPVWGAGLTAIVLTGMGHDGRGGCRVIAEHGGLVVAQDEASSVVWGMPGAVVNAGLAHHVLALGDIAPFVDELAGVQR